MPAITKSAVVKALTAPAKFLLAQGTSTKPAIGSQTRPSIFLNTIAPASKAISGVPPIISTVAAAPIAAADPHSAWHPPSAPANVAFCAIIIPTAEDANKP